MEQANTFPEIYAHCTTYAQLLSHLSRPAVSKLAAAIRSFKLRRKKAFNEGRAAQEAQPGITSGPQLSRRRNKPASAQAKRPFATLEEAFQEHRKIHLPEPQAELQAHLSPDDDEYEHVPAPELSEVGAVSSTSASPQLREPSPDGAHSSVFADCPPSSSSPGSFISSASFSFSPPPLPSLPPLPPPPPAPPSPPVHHSPLRASHIPVTATDSFTELARRVAALEQHLLECVPPGQRMKKRKAAEPEDNDPFQSEHSDMMHTDQEERAADEEESNTTSSSSVASATVSAESSSSPDARLLQLQEQVVAAQQQCEELNAQLTGSREELLRTRHELDTALQDIRNHERDDTSQLQQMVVQLTAQLAEQRELVVQTTTSAAVTHTQLRSEAVRLKGELQDSQQNVSRLQQQLDEAQREVRTSHSAVDAINKEKQQLESAVESSKLELTESVEQSKQSMLLGYTMRACDEFVLDCPLYHRPLDNQAVLDQVTKDRTARVLACLQDFTKLCSSAADQYQHIAVVASSSQQDVHKAFRVLCKLLHTDKLPMSVDGDNKGVAFNAVKVCVERMKMSDVSPAQTGEGMRWQDRGQSAQATGSGAAGFEEQADNAESHTHDHGQEEQPGAAEADRASQEGDEGEPSEEDRAHWRQQREREAERERQHWERHTQARQQEQRREEEREMERAAEIARVLERERQAEQQRIRLEQERASELANELADERRKREPRYKDARRDTRWSAPHHTRTNSRQQGPEQHGWSSRAAAEHQRHNSGRQSSTASNYYDQRYYQQRRQD